ncbi:MAG: hypothetical protein ACKV2O_08585 [Acidimicrobiales bacterium]
MSFVPLDQPDELTLNPAQTEAAVLLREPRDQRPVHRVELRAELRAFLEQELQEMAAGLTEPLFISKHTLASVHGCEEKFLHELHQPFVANAATVRGAVAHKAIELSVAAPSYSPAKLVDRALLRMREGQDWSADWLRGADELDQAEVRIAAADRVAKFIECFPPLRSGWRPVAESRWAQDLHSGKIALRGKVDLTIGGPDGMRAGKVVIDLKTGGTVVNVHAEDLRFYALLETLRLGTPPWKIASYYLDSGTFALELVNEDLLFQAARRLIDGAIKFAELRHGERPPRRAPGPACRWCALFVDCPDGKRARDADGDEP